jgi:hypothetical protein
MNMAIAPARFLEGPISPASSSSAASGDSKLISALINEPAVSSSAGLTFKGRTQTDDTSLQAQLALKLLSFKQMTSPIARYLDPAWQNQLFDTLDKLFAVEDWDDEFALPEEYSFATFLRLVIHLHPTKRPGIGLSVRGHVLASWSRDRDRIVVECLPNDELRWVLSQSIVGNRESAAGKNKIHRLRDLIEGYEPDRFFEDGDKVIA